MAWWRWRSSATSAWARARACIASRSGVSTSFTAGFTPVPRWPSPPHVTAPSDRHPGIHVHRSHHEARVLRLTTPTELATLLTRYPGRRTSPLTPERGATRSHLEDRFIRFLKRHHLPLPELNQQMAGHEVDAVYRAHHLVIELDSRQFHATPRAFEQDRERDADLLSSRSP